MVSHSREPLRRLYPTEKERESVEDPVEWHLLLAGGDSEKQVRGHFLQTRGKRGGGNFEESRVGYIILNFRYKKKGIKIFFLISCL